MKTRILLLLLPLLSASVAAAAPPPGRSGGVEQRVEHPAAFVEPHTPGSGTPEEVPAADGIEGLLGAPVDLHRVTTVRTTWAGPSQCRPNVVSIVVPGKQSANVPVIAIGGSNGLTPEPRSFASYLGSIATPEEWQEIHVVPGDAHPDVIDAERNEAVPRVADFVERVKRIRPSRR